MTSDYAKMVVMQEKRFPSSRIFHISIEQSQLALAFKVSAVALAIIAFYFHDLSIIFREALTNEASSYTLLIPVLFVYLIYRKRRMLRAAIPGELEDLPKSTRHFPLVSGLIICFTAVIVYWYGSYTFTPLEFHILTLPVFTAGLTLVLFNLGTLRQALFPIAFLAFLTQPPSDLLYSFGSTLSVVSSEATNAVVNFLGVHSTISGQFGTPTINIIRPDGSPMSFAVDIACSGIYSLIGFLIFGAFIAYVVRDKTWKKIAVFSLGFPIVYLLNILRLTLIVLIGYQWGEQLALDVFHLLGGWVLIFVGTLLLLVTAEKIFKTQIFTKKAGNTCQDYNSEPPDANAGPNKSYCFSCGRLLKHQPMRFRRSDGAKILIIAVAVALAIQIQTPIFALTQGPAQIMIQTQTGERGNTEILPNMTGYSTQYLYRDTEFEEMSGQDLSLVYTYVPEEQSKQTVGVTLEIADAVWPLHRWEICLVTWPETQGYQVNVKQLDLRDTLILENPPVTARYFAFQYKESNLTQLVMYWYESTVFTIGNTTMQKNVKISLIAYPNSPEEVASAEEQLLPFAKTIAEYWEPIKTWTTIAMTISQNGLLLATVSTGFLAAVIFIYYSEVIRQTRANADAYDKLSKPNQQVVSALLKTERESNPTLEKIHETYKQTTNESVDMNQLEQSLGGLEKTGVIRRSVTNIQDEPTETWKTRMSLIGRRHPK